MPITLGKRTATLSGAIGIDDVEPLVSWLGETRRPAVNLRRCTHIHTAVLQALLAARAQISAAPDDAFLSTWILPTLAGAAGNDKDPSP